MIVTGLVKSSMAKEALGNQDIDFEVPASVGQIKAIIRKAQKTKSLQ